MSLDSRDVWDDRLENWAMWMEQRGFGASVVSSIYDMAILGGSFDHGDPFALSGEASDTHALVMKLEAKYRQALEAWYRWTGTYQENANLLGIPLQTLKDRVAAAKIKLDELHRALATQRARDLARRNKAMDVRQT